MALSKSTRMYILLAIDLAFFLLELIVGYAVHSLALVADSFHMLNDVLSLCVGLWAVTVAGRQTQSRVYTYGWQRAETLGALVNGVFLVALCMSIFLEAIQRFIEPQEVSSPKLVLIVGCFGLLSNVIGLFLFHDHGHSHGDRGHSHEHADETRAAEEGHAHTEHTTAEAIADERAPVANVLPETRVTFPSTPPTHRSRRSIDNVRRGEASSDTTSFRTAPTPTSRRIRTRSKSRTYSGLEEIPIHPASFRNEIIAASRLEDVDDQSGEDADTEAESEAENGYIQLATTDSEETITHPTEHTPLLSKTKSKDSHSRSHSHSQRRKSLSSPFLHKSHKHAQPKSSEDKKAHGHSHDLNMRGVFLHVMGDALGNLGVIATALFIWLTDFWWRFYSDPLVSLIITMIILGSALPLCRAASRILLQAVPMGLNVDDIRDDITDIPGVLSCHHLHVWQLSDTKLIASLHVQIAFEFKDEGSQRYMQIARQIRECLHQYGIHSSTIQPEFCCERVHGHKLVSHLDDDVTPTEGETAVDSGEGRNGELDRHDKDRCMLDCDDECGDGGKCCPLNRKGAASDGKKD